jgi:hypothetical protein
MHKHQHGRAIVIFIASIEIIGTGISTASAEDNTSLIQPKYFGAQVDDPEKNNFGYDSKAPSDLSVRFCNGCAFGGSSGATKTTKVEGLTTQFGSKTGDPEKDTVAYAREISPR